ncbi:MAG: archaellin/type IV pilin N-terminal domain-containing protein, partial [Candidatus Parvarchaeota archaeon]
MFHGTRKYFRKGLNSEERAVSPVIATILLIAITVVLAAALYVSLGHFGTGSAAPLTGSFGVMQSTSDSATLQLTYTIPTNMTTLSNVHITLLSTTGAVLTTFTLTAGP